MNSRLMPARVITEDDDDDHAVFHDDVGNARRSVLQSLTEFFTVGGSGGGRRNDRPVNRGDDSHSNAIRKNMQAIKRALFSSWLNVFLIFVPGGIIASNVSSSHTFVFILNFLAIIPLAKLLGEATEALSEHTSQTIGGLLNATFGNAVEVILSIVALKAGEIRVVQAQILGSILSNLLLVLGACFLAGGLKYKEQRFNVTAAQTSSSLMAMSVLSMLVPAAFVATLSAGKERQPPTDPIHDIITPTLLQHPEHIAEILALSRGTSVVLLIIYVLFLIFQLKTHQHLYLDHSASSTSLHDGHYSSVIMTESAEEEELHGRQGIVRISQGRDRERGDASEDEAPMSIVAATTILLLVTLLITICAEALMNAIEHVTHELGLTKTFIGIILLPIVGNAAEHLTAVSVAMKNKMNLAIAVAIGSSTQIALFVMPLLVILAWIMNINLTLYFEEFETAIMFISVLVVNYLIQDGNSNWLEGAMLLASYVIIAIAFYYLPAI